MIKMIFTMKRKAGLSREEFRDYYETRHVPFISALLPAPQSYRRNYLTGEEADFDVITEIVYASPAAAEAAQEAMARPEVGAAIQADEAHFIAPGTVRLYPVETCEASA